MLESHDMPTRCRVVLYGDSLVLAGVGMSLDRYPRLQVIPFDPTSADAPRALDALHPAAVILDLTNLTPDAAFSLLTEHPDVLLIGLDPDRDRLVVFSGQKARSLSTTDLVQLIETGVPMARSVNGR